jgi:CRISPR-associated protein Cas6
MPKIELHFPVLGTSIPTDHGYALYSALSRILPQFHSPDSSISLGGISGQYSGNGLLQIAPHRSRLRLRLPAEDIPLALPLAGKSFHINGHSIRLGVPQVRALIPAPNLIARMVTMKRSDRGDPNGTKNYMEPREFLDAVGREFVKRGIRCEPAISMIREGRRAGQPLRRVLRIKDKHVVGFGLHVSGLTVVESIELQENGLGGRRKMGCGFFVAMK